MTARGKEAAALALHRFGFGPAGQSIAAIAADPQGALLADLERPRAGLVAANLPSSGESAREVFDFRAEQAAKKKLALRTQKQAEAENAASPGPSAGLADEVADRFCLGLATVETGFDLFELFAGLLEWFDY